MSTAPRPWHGAASRFLDVLVLGLWHTNCYVLGDRELGTCVVVDPGQHGARAVRDVLAERGVRCEAILLTHGHLDHVWAVPELADTLDVGVRLHPADRWLWEDPAAGTGTSMEALHAQYGFTWDPSAERLEDIADGQRLRVAGWSMTVRHTPGHTPGSSVFLCDRDRDDPLMLSGDLLFAGSVGRTDLPRGSWSQQEDSLRRVVLPLPDATDVAPGHGPSSTVGAERRSNPFLRDLGGSSAS